MRVLLIGSGGREHALAWRLAKSKKCEELFCIPGNAGIEDVAECFDINPDDIDKVVQFAKDKNIDFCVIGPEAPLVAGLSDPLREAGIKVFGPSKDAAILEGSKGFMKDLAAKYNIPTAAYGRFSNIDEAKDFVQEHGAPIVVKADGLAAGKGVIICQTVEEANAAIEDMLSGNAFGQAGHEVVIEEFLDGEEVSFFALTDGQTVLPLTSAQDHKRAYDGDTGPNTGGMGAYSPAHIMTADLEKRVMEDVITPTVEGMKAEGKAFTGVLFAGLMIQNGNPKLIEYNIRFGDPECQCMMVRLHDDLLDLLYACADQKLSEYSHLDWSDQTSLCVVMASQGYPQSYTKGSVITGVQDADREEKIKVFHAGTARDESNNIVNTGGRVLNIVAADDTVLDAQKRCYDALSKIQWHEGFYRKDIGWRAIEAHKKTNAA